VTESITPQISRVARRSANKPVNEVEPENGHSGVAAAPAANCPASSDALGLPFPDAQFDLVVCRHLLQAVPDAGRVLAEISRVLRPGGRMHLIAEDYGMLLCHPTALGSDGFWQRFPSRFGAAVGCDMHVGRKTYTLLHDLGMADIAVDYVVVDTLRVARDTFARIWEAWCDGYTESLVEHSGSSRQEIEQRWREMIDCARDPRGYALWQVPVWTAVRPAESVG
jgi:SAM-dependent methyltransferase